MPKDKSANWAAPAAEFGLVQFSLRWRVFPFPRASEERVSGLNPRKPLARQLLGF